MLSPPEAPAAAAREPVSWPTILRSSRLWNLLAVSFLSTFLWQFYITWFPTYLIRKRGLPLKEAALYAGLPFLFGMMGGWLGGVATDFLTARLGVRRARLWVGCTGLALTATLMLIGVLVQLPRLGAALDGRRSLCRGPVHSAPAWSSAVEIGGAAAGAVAGLNNALSNCAAFASPVLMGMVLQFNGSWNTLLVAGIISTYVSALALCGRR